MWLRKQSAEDGPQEAARVEQLKIIQNIISKHHHAECRLAAEGGEPKANRRRRAAEGGEPKTSR